MGTGLIVSGSVPDVRVRALACVRHAQLPAEAWRGPRSNAAFVIFVPFVSVVLGFKGGETDS
jgi:hypothetical protein